MLAAAAIVWYGEHYSKVCFVVQKFIETDTHQISIDCNKVYSTVVNKFVTASTSISIELALLLI